MKAPGFSRCHETQELSLFGWTPADSGLVSRHGFSDSTFIMAKEEYQSTEDRSQRTIGGRESYDKKVINCSQT